MKLKDFYKKYGTHTTSNFQLIKYANELKIPNFHVCMRNELKSIKLNEPNVLNIITNIHTSDQNGVHWSALYIDLEKACYFDSFGLQPTKEVIDIIPKNLNKIRNTVQLQNFNDSYCGQLSLYVLYKLNNGENFVDILF